MYLEHFGLGSPPFKITPVTDFFFSGANRGEILDALIYAITESEGIVKVTGEVGSGKTMLCRMLLERLPQQVESVYLANPSLSREEMLYAIADGLGLNLEGQRVNVIMQTLQNQLAQKSSGGKRVVILVDEAHAMPLDTLEELRLLYNLQIGNHKLLQIVLFGQPELNGKLEQPNMRQLKDRIVHHFSILPLSRSVIESYLLFRMRTAGYRGPNIFSAAAVSLIGKASNGLMRRVNILADKALLAAFVEDTHNIEERHVQAAIRDSELSPQQAGNKQKIALLAGGAALLLGIGWLIGGTGKPADPAIKSPAATAPETASKPAPSADASAVASAAPLPDQTASAATAATPEPAASGVTATVPDTVAGAAIAAITVAASAPTASAVAAVAPVAPVAALPASAVAAALPQAGTTAPPARISPATTGERRSGPSFTRLQLRLAATREMLAKGGRNSASIQLFYTEDAQPARMERFLIRAGGIGKLSEIYVLPIKLNGKEGFRVLYGYFPDIEAARVGMAQLPQRYKKAFAPAIYLLDGPQ
ncbi:MAG: AAA family ATPase [Nitrosomonadales bacterium]|nr:AAA family ATPase [Nitrosomonadales bacterium]